MANPVTFVKSIIRIPPFCWLAFMEHRDLVSLDYATSELRLLHVLKFFGKNEVEFNALFDTVCNSVDLQFFVQLSPQELDGLETHFAVFTNSWFMVSKADFYQSWVPEPNIQFEHFEALQRGVSNLFVINRQYAARCALFSDTNISDIEISDCGHLLVTISPGICRGAKNILIKKDIIILLSIRFFKMLCAELRLNLADKAACIARLKSVMEAQGTVYDPFLECYVAKLLELKRFPLMSELSSVFQPIYELAKSNDDAAKIETVRESEPETINKSNKQDLSKARERVSKIFMSNLVRDIFNLV